MINKYQAGGAAQGSILQEIAKLPQDQQKKIMVAFGKWALAKGLNIQQLQGNEQALEQAMGQFLQEMQGAQKARFGAKLNYIRTLKGNAPEGMVVEYYKCGGQTKKRFVKAAGGEKVKDGKKEIEDFKKKKACGGVKVTKAQPGSKMMQLAEANKERKKAEEDKKKKANTWGATSKVVGRDYQRGSGNDTSEQEKKDKSARDYYQGRADHELFTPKAPKPSKDSKSHSKRFALATVQECGGKAKKHQWGGSLNRIPFYLAGTPKGGIERPDNTRISSGRPQTVQNRIPWGAGKGPAGEGPMRLFNDPYVGIGMMAMAPMTFRAKGVGTNINGREAIGRAIQNGYRTDNQKLNILHSSQIKPEFRNPKGIEAINKVAGEPEVFYTDNQRAALMWRNLQKESWDKLSQYLKTTKFTK